jgi:HEAT repeat protein
MRTSLGIVLSLAVSASAWAGHNSSAADLAAAVGSGSDDSILAAIEQAEYLPSTGAINVVLPLIDHPSAKVRDAAGWWLSRRDTRAQVIATCASRLTGSDPIAARNCGDVLGGMRDARTISSLTGYLAHPLDEASGASVAKALGAIGHPSALASLNGALGSSLAGVRSQAAASLRDLRAPTGTTVAAQSAPLLPLVNDSDAGVRRQAILTLGFIGWGGGDVSGVITALSATLQNDSSPIVRKAAAWALGQLKDGAARNALIHAESDGDPFVRSVAAASLANLH